jgi:hypothetical protein
MEAGMRDAWSGGAICLVLLAAVVLTSQLSCRRAGPDAAGALATPGYDRYASEEFGVSFDKPNGWNVTVAKDAVFIKAPSGGSDGIFLFPVYRAAPRTEAVSFVRFMYEQALAEHPDLKIEERRANGTNTVAEVTAGYTDRETKAVTRGFYLVSIDGGRGIFCGYEAPADKFDRAHAALRHVLKSLRISPATFYNATRRENLRTAGSAPPPQVLAPTIDVNALQVTLSPERTMYLAVPADWTVGGGNYSLIATSPDKRMGVTATNDAQPATRDPHTYLLKALLPFYKCSATTVHKREPNEAIMAFSRSQGYSSRAEDFVGETTQGDGQKVYFWMMVNAATGVHGGGFVSTIGFYAVPGLFERNSRVLYAMTASMGPNQQEIMRVLRENLGRLDSASRTIAATGDLVIQGLRSRTANWDRAMDKYNYYLSGEEARYSPLENRIYVVDSNLEKYAGNPRYPQEALSDVPDRLWNTLPHLR